MALARPRLVSAPADAEQIVTNLLRPRRDPGVVAAAGAIVRRSDSFDEAWEAFATNDLISAEWIGEGSVRGSQSWEAKWGTPACARSTAAIGSDPSGLAGAVAMMREAVSAGAPWAPRSSQSGPSIIIGAGRARLGELLDERLRPPSGKPNWWAVSAAVAAVRRSAPPMGQRWQRAYESFREAAGDRSDNAVRYAAELWQLGWVWASLASEGRVIPALSGHLARPATQGLTFADLPSPFAPLLGVLALGYWGEVMEIDQFMLAVPELTDVEAAWAGLPADGS